MGLYWDNGKSNGNYYSIVGLLYSGYILECSAPSGKSEQNPQVHLHSPGRISGL